MPNATCDRQRYRLVVAGVSMGGVQALKKVLGALPADFPLPILIVQHMSPASGDGLAALLDQLCLLRVKEADEEDVIKGGWAYLAPPNYHLLVEGNGTLSLSGEKPVNFARPSVDVLFESAAAAFGPSVIGVILTGAGYDGGLGLQRIKSQGGTAIVQDPADAEAASMPEHALRLVAADYVVTLEELPGLLLKLAGQRKSSPEGGGAGADRNRRMRNTR